jgi:outer membrane protein
VKTNFMKTILVCSCLLIFSLTVPAGEVKIGLIDLKKVFDDYYKTKLADASIKDEAAGLDKDRKAMTDEYQKAVEDYKKSVEEANNQAISLEEREKRKKEAEGRLIKVNDLEQSIKQFDRTARGNLEEKQRLARDKILTEIRTVVNEKAKVAGYTLVFDSAAEALSRTRLSFTPRAPTTTSLRRCWRSSTRQLLRTCCASTRKRRTRTRRSESGKALPRVDRRGVCLSHERGERRPVVRRWLDLAPLRHEPHGSGSSNARPSVAGPGAALL